ncbi:hypothetical protein RFI_05511 [Reticulomyxa filosa]|uniref:Uncharacterized protein n=1 Tax=Reticulomyxa filosa TaxID=46433 RepID=X6P222_RETFI|nr:hypothetical protein RFI_05511 [Reticulomyxa filosa]|eukprot:ETO31607.1 hypothetical protein RFI_05511 [Reticulomyxa filosa]
MKNEEQFNLIDILSLTNPKLNHLFYENIFGHEKPNNQIEKGKRIKILTFCTFEKLDEQWKIFILFSSNCDKIINTFFLNKLEVIPVSKNPLFSFINYLIFSLYTSFSSSLHHQRSSQGKKKRRYFTLVMKVSFKLFFFFLRFYHFTLWLKQSNEEEIQIIIHHWIRIMHIKFGWINELDKLVVNYVSTVFMFEKFRSSSKLINTFTGHTNVVYSIDYSTFDDRQFICSGSYDNTVRVWDVDNNKQIQLFNGHSFEVYCVKFSSYHYHNNSQHVICSSSFDKTIRFWDFKHNKQLQILNENTRGVRCMEFSSFNGGRYLCSGSWGGTIHLWDVETSKSLHIFNEHMECVRCVDISPLQINNKSDNIGVIGGNGYTICSGSFDKTIRIWDIETASQLNVFKGHTDFVNSVKYGSNELLNTILSGSCDKSVRLWDIRSGQQIQVFKRHTNVIWSVEYSPFVMKNSIGNSNAICSGSWDNTIRFWDIRSNKNQLFMIKGDDNEDCGIICLKFIRLKKKDKTKNVTYDLNLCYGSGKGPIRIWG